MTPEERFPPPSDGIGVPGRLTQWLAEHPGQRPPGAPPRRLGPNFYAWCIVAMWFFPYITLYVPRLIRWVIDRMLD